MSDPTPDSAIPAPSPTTLSAAMNLVAAEAIAAGTPFTSGAALQAITEARFPALIAHP